MTWLRMHFPQGLAARFVLLLLAALIGVNAIAAFLLAREGYGFDRAVRIQRDMGRLVALVTALEQADADTSRDVLAKSNTAYTRFSLDPAPIGPAGSPSLQRPAAEIERALPGRAVRVTEGSRPDAVPEFPPLLLLSVQLAAGIHEGRWINSLVYPLPLSRTWWQSIHFFAPLSASLFVILSIGMIFIHKMTEPLRQFAEAARAAGRGDRSARVAEAGARELREAATAFNDMQRRIADFDAERMRLVAAIAHDLRTPITGLRIRAEMLDDEEAREAMVRVLDDIAVMTKDLLHYARRIHEGEESSEVDVSALLKRLCDERGVRLESSAPIQLRLRPVAMARAIDNLLDNAMRYAGSCSVRLERTEAEALITVKDEGPGIAPYLLERIFEPFVRGENSRSTETGGVGLGLSIARSIVMSHGGTLALFNRAEGGLRVELRLPLNA